MTLTDEQRQWFQQWKAELSQFSSKVNALAADAGAIEASPNADEAILAYKDAGKKTLEELKDLLQELKVKIG